MEETKKQTTVPTTFAELMEERFARDLKSAVRAWIEAGKPRKR